MKCTLCSYEGSRSKFKRELNSIYTTASGLKPRICPSCNQHNFFSHVDELEDDERELNALCIKMDDAIRTTEIDIASSRKHLQNMIELNTFLNA